MAQGEKDDINIFAVYKPLGITSSRVVEIIKEKVRSQKVGHAGTLDPLAEGVLVVGIGRAATKRLSKEVAKEKEYKVEIRLGIKSTTDDEEGEKVESQVLRVPSKSEVSRAVEKWVGKVKQRPPIYSALKIKGKRAYELARKGKHVELAPREVEIKSIKIESFVWPQLVLNVITGPGVYIRSLARDIGEDLGVGGFVTRLIRERVGEYKLKEALKLENL